MKKQMGMVALLLAAIVVLSMGLTAALYEDDGRRQPFTVTAAFYPMYTAALRVVGEVPGVSVTCLTAPTAGCMHDYQLSPDEMTALTAADLLILNGEGAESFLEHALATLPDLTVIDTSVGTQPLESLDHDHHDHGHYNEHLWVSPQNYRVQVENLRDGLCAADPANAEAYTRNAAAYLAEIGAVQQELEQLTLPIRQAVLFHSSVAYLAAALGLDTTAYLPLGEDEGLSAADLTAAAEAVRGQAVLLLYDKQYPGTALSLDTYAARTVTVVLDTAVTPLDGVDDGDTWLIAMKRNVQALKEAVA